VTTAVAQPRLVTDEQALSERKPQAIDLVALASNPDVSVEKLERLMAMQERMQARYAEECFNAAMADAQKKMRPVAANADNPQTKSRYATYTALDSALRPIYSEHGFGLSFDSTESTIQDHVRVLCYVTHRDGGARTYKVDMPNDGKGAKGGDVMTKTHAQGAAMSYGMRYLLKMIFNVAIGEDDRDGNDPTEPVKRSKSADVPKGFDDWVDSLQDASMQGVAELEKAYGAGAQNFKGILTLGKWTQLKNTAKQADGAK